MARSLPPQADITCLGAGVTATAHAMLTLTIRMSFFMQHVTSLIQDSEEQANWVGCTLVSIHPLTMPPRGSACDSQLWTLSPVRLRCFWQVLSAEAYH